MNPKHFAIAAGASLLAMTAGTPAKAINYYLTGTDTYDCNGATATTCTITYNDFGISYDGSTWTQLTTGTPGTIVFTNDSNSDNISFLQGFTSILNTGSDDAVGFQAGSNTFYLSLTSPGVDGTTSGAGATTNSLVSTTFTSTTLTPDDPNEALSGTGAILGVPFSASALALLPLGMFSKRVKRRVLSV